MALCGETEEVILQTICQVFKVSWREQGPGVIYLEGLASEFAENIENGEISADVYIQEPATFASQLGQFFFVFFVIFCDTDCCCMICPLITHCMICAVSSGKITKHMDCFYCNFLRKWSNLSTAIFSFSRWYKVNSYFFSIIYLSFELIA